MRLRAARRARRRGRRGAGRAGDLRLAPHRDRVRHRRVRQRLEPEARGRDRGAGRRTRGEQPRERPDRRQGAAPGDRLGARRLRSRQRQLRRRLQVDDHRREAAGHVREQPAGRVDRPVQRVHGRAAPEPELARLHRHRAPATAARRCDKNWCPTGRQNVQSAGADYLGVYVQANVRHRHRPVQVAVLAGVERRDAPGTEVGDSCATGLKTSQGAGLDADHEGGFVAVFISLVLMVMLMFAAFTVDFGSWYTRSAELKRAADAAALAGVVWMPEFDQAQQYAVAAAAKNGFVNGQSTTSPWWCEDVPNNNRQLKVTIRDNKAKQFFSTPRDPEPVDRAVVDRRVRAAGPARESEERLRHRRPLAQRTADRENFWAAVSGYCAGHESGDKKRRQVRVVRQQQQQSAATTDRRRTHDDYDPNGYLYAVDVPANATSLALDVYDGELQPIGSSRTCRRTASWQPPEHHDDLQVYDRNATPLDLSATSPSATRRRSRSARTRDVPEPVERTSTRGRTRPAGRYYVRVPDAGCRPTNSRGSNGFALRAFTGRVRHVLDDHDHHELRLTCPQVHAVSDMSIYANLTGTTRPTSTSRRSMPSTPARRCASTCSTPVKARTRSRSSTRQRGDPTTSRGPRRAVPRHRPSADAVDRHRARTSVRTRRVGGGCPQPYSGLHSTQQVQRPLSSTIDIPLPSNYTTGPAATCWWKVRYNVTAPPTDRTTWSVNIVGDPVHLLQ